MTLALCLAMVGLHLVEQGGEDFLVAVHVDTVANTLQFLLILCFGLFEGFQLDQQVSIL